MRSASITRRAGIIILHPWSKTVTGVGLGTPPFIVLDANEAPQKFGEAIIKALDAAQSGLPHPAQDEWSSYDAPLYAAAGVKSWSAFVKGAVSSTILEHQTELEFAPLLNRGSRGGFQEAGIERLTIPRDASAAVIGEAAIKSLDLAKAAESNPQAKKKVARIPVLPQPERATDNKQPSIPPQNSGKHESFLRSIEKLGFFRYTDAKHIDQERTAIRKQGWAGIFGENGRWFFADAEDLAEGGVSEFIAEITLFLEQQAVKISPLEDEFDPYQQYTLIAGEERFPIWTEQEYKKEADQPGLLWGVSSSRTVQILNNWLERAGSAERAYGVNGGNDFAIFFLTPELYGQIRQDPEALAHDGPYVPNLEYPSFGQPPPR